MGKIASFKLDRVRALSLIREIASDSRNVIFVENAEKGPWEARVTHLQIIRCLEDGDIVSDPLLDDYKNWRVQLRRTAARVCMEVTCIILMNENGKPNQIAIIDARSEVV